MCAGVSRGGDKRNLMGRPAHGGQHPRAILGGLGPFLDRVADRDVPQDPGQNVLPERFHLGPGREADQGCAALTVNAGRLHAAKHIADGGLAMRIQHAGPLQPRQVHCLRIEAEAFNIRASHVTAAHRCASGPDHLDGAIIAVGAGRGQVGTAG
jgi:hypothetical protein